jgi:hypothetical protein
MSVKLNVIFVILILSIGCERPASSQNKAIPLYESDVFKKYWYSGLAEISSYDLDQSRYGETRKGKTILIFVTEDFSQTKQVKLDQPEKFGKDKVSVLKMNFTKNFITGIYPYSMMLSSFTPIEASRFPNTLKTAMTSQEWCGQTFAQLNLKGSNYLLQSNSYFEQEGDQKETYKAVVLEDELLSRIRLDPGRLPLREFEILPGLFFTRLLHVPMTVTKALAEKKAQNETVLYSITFPEHKRSIVIQYQKKFPHRILSWTETFVERGKTVTTKATIAKTIRSDYWTKNKNEFSYLRDSLGLSRSNN